MVFEPPTQRVRVTFAGVPPAQQVERASGVSHVTCDGQVLHCMVCGSFQPFLEALRGHEVLSLITSEVDDVAGKAQEGDR